MFRVILIFLLSLFFNPFHNSAPGAEIGAEYPELSPEELAWIEIPEVITPSRKPQPLTESPSSVSMITAEEIKNSGATDIPDLLRGIPGLDVIEVTKSQFEISARGLNWPYANKMLVMIDGRSIYKNFLGHTMWKAITIQLEEIKRIEVIRGPGSALYGANAFSGVINIITSSPEELEGTVVKGGAGNLNTYQLKTIHGEVKDRFSYKISANWDRSDNWKDRGWKGEKTELLKADLRMQYKLKPDKNIILQGGVTEGDFQVRCLHGGSYTNIDPGNSYYRLAYQQPDLSVQIFGNRTRQKERFIDREKYTNINSDLNKAEFQHTFNLTRYQTLVWGGSFRYDRINATILDKKHSQNIWGGYIQDEISPAEPLKFTLGGRYDYNSQGGGHATPRISLIYEFIENHSLRLSYSTAFRDPSFVELYRYLNKPLDGITLQKRGNDDLDPEEISSWELGYSSLLFHRVRGEFTLFYNEIKNMIEEYAVSSTPTEKTMSYRNSADTIQAYGGEAGLNFLIGSKINGFANYSYQYLKDKHTDERIKTAPLNKFNIGATIKIDHNLTSNLVFHYMDSTDWGSLGDTDAYTLVNGRIGYSIPGTDLVAALSFFNLFNDVHQEYPFGDRIGREYLFTLNLIF